MSLICFSYFGSRAFGFRTFVFRAFVSPAFAFHEFVSRAFAFCAFDLLFVRLVLVRLVSVRLFFVRFLFRVSALFCPLPMHVVCSSHIVFLSRACVLFLSSFHSCSLSLCMLFALLALSFSLSLARARECVLVRSLSYTLVLYLCMLFALLALSSFSLSRACVLSLYRTLLFHLIVTLILFR